MKQSKENHEPQEHKHHRFKGNPVTYTFTIIILAVIAIALIGGPAISGAVRGNQPVYGVYAGQEIKIEPGNFFQRRAQFWASYFQQLGGENTEQAYYQLLQYAYADTVLHTAFLVAARGADIDVSSRNLDNELAQWPEFIVDGRFSTEEYQSMSSAEMLTLREYLHEVMVARQVREDIDTVARYSDAEMEFIAAMASPERRFRYVEFSFDTFPETEVIKYGENNLQRFRQLNISQITIDSSESDAESIRQQALDRTSSFEDLARNQSSDEFADDGGERGWAYYWDLEFDFEDIALVDELFALEEGGISPVYKTGTRWRIYRVNEAPLDPDFADPDVTDDVRVYLTTFERGLVEDFMRVNATVFASEARSNGFDAAARGIDQSPALTGYFPVNYSNMSIFESVSAPANTMFSTSGAYRDEFLQQLFALEPGEVSEPIVLRDYVFVMELEDERNLTGDRLDELMSRLSRGLASFQVPEYNQAFVVDDLYVDNFNQAYATAVLGQ